MHFSVVGSVLSLHGSSNSVHIVRVIEDVCKTSKHNHFPVLKALVNDRISPLLLLIYDRIWVNKTSNLTLRDYYEHWNEDRSN